MTERHVIGRSSDILIDYLRAGNPLDDFLDDFPTVDREQVTAVLELVKAALLARSDITDAT